MNVKLTEVGFENFESVIELELDETQKKYLPSNLYSIAESRFMPSSYLRAICVDDEVVGFLEYQFGQIGEPDEDECTIWRFMIDRKRQNAGIGTAAMAVLLEEIRAHRRCSIVDIYYDPQNLAAKKLYASFGFSEVGDRDDGTVIAEVKIESDAQRRDDLTRRRRRRR